MMPAPMIAATQAPAASTLSKPSSIGRAPSAARRMRTVASVTTPSWPFRAADQAEEVVAGGIEMLAADLDDLAVDQHHA